MSGQFLNLMPKELQTGDEYGDAVFLSLEEMLTDDPFQSRKANCYLHFHSGTVLWHTEAPLRVYRPDKPNLDDLMCGCH